MASRGLVGLRNVGNTCFMNSIVQCLSNTKLLLEYCLNDEYQDDINTTTSNMKGALINGEFQRLIHGSKKFSWMDCVLLRYSFPRGFLKKSLKSQIFGIFSAYTKLMKSLWKTSGESYVSPTEFKSQVQKFAPRFTGYKYVEDISSTVICCARASKTRDSRRLSRIILMGTQHFRDFVLQN